jgi:hypothetical protein
VCRRCTFPSSSRSQCFRWRSLRRGSCAGCSSPRSVTSSASGSSSGRGSRGRLTTLRRLSNTTAHSCRERALTAGPLERGMPGPSAYPDKGSMRVHTSLRDDVRLWGWAGAATLALFTVIVVLGIAPSPFPSIGVGRAHSHPTVVVHSRAPIATPAVRHASPAVAQKTAKPKRRIPVAGTQSPAAQPKTQPTTRRPGPAPVGHKQTPDPSSAPTATPAPAEDAEAVTTPSLPVPPVPDPGSLIPTLPTVPVPPLPDPTDVVPALPLP